MWVVDISWLQVLPPAIAAVASFVAIIIPLSELGAASRARRRATFWKEHLEASPIPQDQAIAQSLYRDASAAVIAFEAYPGRKLAYPWLSLVLLPLVAVGAVAYVLGTTDSSDRSYTGLVGTLGMPFILSIGVQLVMNTVIRRRLLATQYLQGKTLDAEKRIDRNGNDVTPGNVQTIGQFLGTLVFCFGACLAVGSIGFLSGAATTGGDSGSVILVSSLVGVGIVLTFMGGRPLGSILRQGRREWVHPQTLPPALEESQSESGKAARTLSTASKQLFAFLIHSWRGRRPEPGA